MIESVNLPRVKQGVDMYAVVIKYIKFIIEESSFSSIEDAKEYKKQWIVQNCGDYETYNTSDFIIEIRDNRQNSK